jgi:DNA modification methylase
MGAERVNVAVTSPPYASQRAYDEASGFKPIPPDEYVDWFADVSARVADHLAADGSWFVNIKEHCDDGQRSLYVKDLTLAHVRDWGWQFVDEFVWTHGGTPKAVRRRFKNGWEPIFQFTRGEHKFRPDTVMHATNDVPAWGGLHPNMEDVQQHGCTEGMKRKGVDSRSKQTASNADLQGTAAGGKAIHDAVEANTDGMAYPSNVLSCGKNREALGHSAAYPVSLPSFFIKAFSDESDNVYDPFLGSGTTMLAAEQLNRRCFGMELSPKYVAVILQRMQDAGCECTLQED